MSTNFHPVEVEPFPLFVDLAPPNSANYFSSPIAMAAIQLLTAATSSKSSSLHKSLDSTDLSSRKPRVSTSAKVSQYLRLRYYQYEVTFGLYMLTSAEKWLFNCVLGTILAAVVFGVCWGFQDWVVYGICRLLYYATGNFAAAGRVCS